MYSKAEVLNDPAVDAAACQLSLASPDHSDADLEPLLRRWSAKHTGPAPHMAPRIQGQFAGVRRRHPLTIGYHCIFWGDVTAQVLALPFIAAHDRDAFRVIGYSPWQEAAQVEQRFDVFRGSTEKLDDDAFAALVRADAVDIFVELSGLSHYHRFGAMALRCAPIQVHYINHLGTSQVANVDYVVGDATAFPKGCDLFYSEKIYRLPTCFLCYDYASMSMPEPVEPPFIRNGFITFGSFGGPFKLNAECLELWAMVLHAVPNSRLLLQNAGMSKQSNVEFMHRQFRRLGIDERVVILPGADRLANLQNYAQMDICLDTWPYCGGNSTAEALWSGVPVVTLKGSRAVAAYGASLLAASGLPDLIAHSPAEYVQLACGLAGDDAQLSKLRSSMRRMMRENGLADPVRMARALEAAFQDMARLKFGQYAVSIPAAAPPGMTSADVAA
jgi:predicted O-linked N-acetylglucosamine transferase (SPINDLY family)